MATDNNGKLVQKYEPVVEETLNIKKENLEAVFNGMLGVTQGSSGTLSSSFKDFPVAVAAKSGTAQESEKRSEHTIFVGFAPYDNPQIAISVLIPYGNDNSVPAASISKTVVSEYLLLNSAPEKTSYNALMK